MEFRAARTLINTHFNSERWVSQSSDEWTGSFSLPTILIEYYARLGPMGVRIPDYSSSYFFPALAQLWKFQAGYRYDGNTGKPLKGWDDNWIVVADNDADPFILERRSGHVLFAHHGTRAWFPVLLFNDLEEMMSCLLTLGAIRHRASRDDFLDAESFIKPEHYSRALTQLSELLDSESRADLILNKLGWVIGQ